MVKKLTPEDLLISQFELLQKKIPPRFREILLQFYACYHTAILASGQKISTAVPHLLLFFQLLEEQFHRPYVFETYHQKIRAPIDYYQFGIDFIGPLVDLSHSTILGAEYLPRISSQLKNGENVILLANHQTETDPQAIAILLQKAKSDLAEKIIYVAGERVVTDPLAIPFSMGCDLLCIYSKRYIDHPPESKAKKQLHNKNTMGLMSRLLEEGGKIIYVAPSGGRDRRNGQGTIEVAPFDPQSIEMFYLMARRAKTPTHFYPLSLSTYDLLPPPETIQTELGEIRTAKRSPIHLGLSEAFDMENFPGSKEQDKTVRRKNRSDAIWKIVQHTYEKLKK
ncbi:MAG: 1-acyl-sn-glycerol-3-phosphate acyltransferase [Chlamydiota bacterium]